MCGHDTAHPYYSLAQQFLLTSSAVIREMIATKNPWVVVTETPLDFEEYDRQTRWSDFNTMLPSLFLFFHGSELLCKGVLLQTGREIPATHDLPTILALIHDDLGLKDIKTILYKYLVSQPNTPSFLARYMSQFDSETLSGTLYESLRYPSTRKGAVFDHSWLRHNTHQILDDLRVIDSDIHLVLSICARRWRCSLS